MAGFVKAIYGGASSEVRLIIVIQNIRQLMMTNMGIKFISRSAVLSLESSALQPDSNILWKPSVFHRNEYHFSFSIASARRVIGN